MLRSLDDWLSVFDFFNRPQLLRLMFVNRFVYSVIEQHFGHRPYGYGILRLLLAWDENQQFKGTEEDECLIGIAICDRRSESLEQENRQWNLAPLSSIQTIRYEWDLVRERGSQRCVQVFDAAHEYCSDDWRLLGPNETKVHCDRAFEHRYHLAADQDFKMNLGNKQYSAVRKLHCNLVLSKLYENEFRRVSTDYGSGMTKTVRIALSDIDIIMKHLSPTYVRLFSVDFSLLRYLSERVWNHATTDIRRQITAEKIGRLLEHLGTIDGIFDAAKVTLPLGSLCHTFSDVSSVNTGWRRILQLLSHSAKLHLKKLSDDGVGIMSAIRFIRARLVLQHNWPSKLNLVIWPEDYKHFGEEFCLNQIAQLLHINTKYDDHTIRRYRLKTIKLSLDGWRYHDCTKLEQFVHAIIERLYQNFVTSSSSAQQTVKLSATDNISYKCILNIDLDLDVQQTWNGYSRFSALFLPKILRQQTPYHNAEHSPPNLHLLNDSGEHWRLQNTLSRWNWKWKIILWRYSDKAEHIPLDRKLEEQDERMRCWWNKCEQLSSTTMFGNGNFDPMMVYDECTRIRVINGEQK